MCTAGTFQACVIGLLPATRKLFWPPACQSRQRPNPFLRLPLPSQPRPGAYARSTYTIATAAAITASTRWVLRILVTRLSCFPCSRFWGAQPFSPSFLVTAEGVHALHRTNLAHLVQPSWFCLPRHPCWVSRPFVAVAALPVGCQALSHLIASASRLSFLRPFTSTSILCRHAAFWNHCSSAKVVKAVDDTMIQLRCGIFGRPKVYTRSVAGAWLALTR